MIVENLTRWDTDDLVRLLERAREAAPAHASKSWKPWTGAETVVVVRHYSSTEKLVTGQPDKRANSGALLLRRPGRVDISIVDALASVISDDGGGSGRMPPDMLEEVWMAAVAFMLTAYAGRYLKPRPVLPAGLQIRVARARGKVAPKWVQHKLAQARDELHRRELRWEADRARLADRIAQLEAKLESYDP